MYGIKKIIMRYTNMYYTLVLLSPLEWWTSPFQPRRHTALSGQLVQHNLKHSRHQRFHESRSTKNLSPEEFPTCLPKPPPPGLPTLGDDSKFQPKYPPTKYEENGWRFFCEWTAWTNHGIMEVSRLNDSSALKGGWLVYMDRFQGP